MEKSVEYHYFSVYVSVLFITVRIVNSILGKMITGITETLNKLLTKKKDM